MLTLCSFGFKSLSCHFGEIYWIELPRTKSSHPTHPVNWIDGVEIICVNCSRFLWCSVLLLFVLVPWTDHQTHLTGMFGPFFSIDLETNLTRSNWPPAHPRSQGNKRACSCVAAKITLLPNNCNWYIYFFFPCIYIWYVILKYIDTYAHHIHWNRDLGCHKRWFPETFAVTSNTLWLQNEYECRTPWVVSWSWITVCTTAHSTYGTYQEDASRVVNIMMIGCTYLKNTYSIRRKIKKASLRSTETDPER